MCLVTRSRRTSLLRTSALAVRTTIATGKAVPATATTVSRASRKFCVTSRATQGIAHSSAKSANRISLRRPPSRSTCAATHKKNRMSAISLAVARPLRSQARSRYTSARTTATSRSNVRIARGRSRSRQICRSICGRTRALVRIRARSRGAASRSRGLTSSRGTRTCIERSSSPTVPSSSGRHNDVSPPEEPIYGGGG